MPQPRFRAREREREVIDALTQLNHVVVATGGGAVLQPENRARLAARGQVIYLQTSVAQQLDRTRHGRQRPLLYTDDPEARLRQLMQQRAPLYESIASFVVATDGRLSCRRGRVSGTAINPWWAHGATPTPTWNKDMPCNSWAK